MATWTRRRLSEMLLKEGMVTSAQIEAATAKQKETGQRVWEILVDDEILTEEQLIDVLTSYLDMGRARLDEVQLTPELLGLIPEEVIKKHHIFPFDLDDHTIKLAVVDPFDFFAQDDVRAATRCDVIPYLATTDEIQRAIDRHHSLYSEAQQIIEQMDDDFDDDDDGLPDDTDDSPRIKIVNMIIAQAIRDRASDIHIEPQEGRIRIRYRIDGYLRDVMEFPIRLRNDIVSRIKVMADLDITERRRPQDGRIRVNYDGSPFDLRSSTLPTIYGEKVVLRILAKADEIVGLETLQFQPENVRAVERMLAQPQGVVLVTGPTGSGKTTTLYSFLHKLNTPEVNVITIEDPVELRLPGLTQVNVSNRAGVSFASALRSVLRQDPDVVMVGEMRDSETTEIAVRAALTGHLVLSTLHTNSAAATLGRLMDMGIEPFLLADTITGVVSQRLVRQICKKCKEPAGILTPFEERFLEGRVGTLMRGKGCPACGDSGYRGRVAIEEVLIMNKTLRKLVRDGVSEEELREAALQSGMITLRESAIRRVLAGMTTVDEVVGAVYSVDDDPGDDLEYGTEDVEPLPETHPTMEIKYEHVKPRLAGGMSGG